MELRTLHKKYIQKWEGTRRRARSSVVSIDRLSRNALERLKAEFVLIDDMVAQIAKMTDDFTNVNNIKTIIVGDALDEDFQAQKTLYESYVSETQVDGTDYTLFAEL